MSGLTTIQVFQDLDSNVVTRFRWFCIGFFRTPVNKFSMDDRIQTGFLGSNGFSVFQGFGRSGFSQFSDAWILLSDVWTFGFSGYWFLRNWIVSFADTKMEKCNRVGKLIRSRRSLARRKYPSPRRRVRPRIRVAKQRGRRSVRDERYARTRECSTERPRPLCGLSR